VDCNNAELRLVRRRFCLLIIMRGLHVLF
jgi:hypothetical protein